MSNLLSLIYIGGDQVMFEVEEDIYDWAAYSEFPGIFFVWEENERKIFVDFS